MLYLALAAVLGLALLVVSLLARVGRLEEQIRELGGRGVKRSDRHDLDDRVTRLEARIARSPYRASDEEGDQGEASSDPEILDALREGNLIGAIKRYRELTGKGLRESKEAVETLRDRIGGRSAR